MSAADDILAAARNNRSWAFRELTGDLKEWTPTRLPRTVTATANVNPLDDLILVSGNSTLTLETAAGADGRRHTFLKTDASNTMTLACQAGQTLSGAATATATAQYQVIGVVCNGTNWNIEYSYNSILGAFSLVDPNADRIVFWDDSAGKLDWLAMGNSVAITGTTLDTIQDIRTTANPQFATLELGAANDTTFTRTAAGRAAIEGKGIVKGPASSTDNAVARFDSTTGELVQDSLFIVDDSGHVSSFGGNIKFPGTQVSSSDANTFDDYEEGTWTPAITFATVGDLTVVYSTQLGTYTKKGREVAAHFSIATSTFTFTTASGNLQMTGQPFTPLTLAGHVWTGTCRWQGITKANYTHVAPRVNSAGAMFLWSASGSAQALSNIVAADTPTAGTILLTGNVIYETA